MRKILIMALCIAACIFTTLSFTACGKGNNGGNKHKHSFTVENVTDEYLCSEATCTEAAKYYYSCKCGEKGTATFAYGNALGHSFTNYVSDNNATHENDGTKTATCDRCDATDTILDVGTKLPHTYDAKWTSDDEYHWHKATCEHVTEVSGKAKHTAGEWIIDEAATYEKAGKRHKECEVCERLLDTEEIPQLEKDEIIFKSLTVNEDNTIYTKVPNSQEVFNFVDEIKVSGKATYVVSLDVYGAQQIPTKKVPLTVGENTIYIIEIIGDNTTTYTVTIHRRAVYSVTFITYCDMTVSSQKVEEDSFANKPEDLEKLGYTFEGWDYDFTKAIVKNTTIKALWSANTDTTYKVVYYFEGNYQILGYKEEEYLQGTTDTTITIEPKKFEHFTFNKKENNVLTGRIAADGSLELRVYYNRNSYSVTVSCDTKKGKIDRTISDYYLYETKFTVEVTKTNAGYTFVGWYKNGELASTNLKYIFSVQGKTHVVPVWRENSGVSYKVKYYLQNIEDDKYTLKESYDFQGTTDETVTAEIKTYTHFTFNEKESKTSGKIYGDGSLSLYVYYTRDQYNVSVNGDNLKAGTYTSINGKYKYDDEIKVSATTNAGYTFDGWFEGETLITTDLQYTFNVERDISLTAKWSTHVDTLYKINYYLQNFEDDEYTLQETFNLKGTTDTPANAEIKTYEHFTFNKDKSNASGNISGDGSLVLNLYYTRKFFVLSNENPEYGEITYAGTYKYGSIDFETEATEYLGCEFVGWYDGENVLSTEKKYLFTIEKNVIAKFKPKEEMSMFVFTAALTTCIITGIKDNGVTEIIIPDYVSDIDKQAFMDCKFLSNIKIGSGVNTINNEVFKNCISLTTITIPNSVLTIGDWAFDGCIGLSEITIPDSVTNIGYRAFNNCEGVKSVTIGKNLKESSRRAFYGCENLITVYWNAVGVLFDTAAESLFYSCYKLTNVIIGEDVLSLPQYAFYNHSNLTNLIIGNNVIDIGYAAFDKSPIETARIPSKAYASVKNENLKNVIITSGESIEDKAFKGCKNLINVTIEDGLINIGSYAFADCSGLTNLQIGNGVKTIGAHAFSGCSSLKNLEIGTSVETINTAAFNGCDSLIDLVIPNNVTKIQYSAFGNCSKLKNITIGEGITVIGEAAFKNCAELRNVYWNALKCNTVGSSSSILYNNAIFENCSKISNVVIGDGVTEIPNYAFANSGVTGVILPNSLTKINEGAFYRCYGLTNITVPKNVTSIGNKAFFDCKKLIEVINYSNLTFTKNSSSYGEIAKNALVVKKDGISDIVKVDDYLFYNDGNNNYLLTYVGDKNELILPNNYNGENYILYKSAFAYCTQLTSIKIPNGITEISSEMFFECTRLINIEMPDSITSIGSLAFYDCVNLVEIEIPNNVTIIGMSAFYNCTNLTNIEIPNSVAIIQAYAFSNCTNLTEVKISSGVTEIGYNSFSDCNNLSNIYITDIVAWCNITGLNNLMTCGTEKNLFLNDKLITNLVIPDSVTSINSYAFYNCSALTSITVGGNVTSIGYNAFEDTAWYNNRPNGLVYVGKIAYRYKGSMSNGTTIVLKNDTKAIVERAFFGCSGLTNITIPDSVINIGEYAFYDCGGIKSATLPIPALKHIDKSSLQKVVFTSGDTIENELLKNNLNLTNVTIPDSVTVIGAGAFFNCNKLISVVMGKNVTNISSNAFKNCSSLTNITIPESVILIGNYAFFGCEKLKNVKFKNTTNWEYCENSTWKTKISSSDLVNTSTAAKYLTSTYVNYYWERN